MAGALMFQGTGSDVGKSLIVGGLCRALANRGLKVRPFKPQNMSNNAAVTHDGGEIGRAQALQALACKVPLSVHMNPVLLKPESSTGAQVIVRGQRVASFKAREYMAARERFLPDILESFEQLNAQADIVLVEGAGSPAEINLRAGDIANMGFAHAANVPVALVADIHRGGVMASITGTFDIIPSEDAELIRTFLINKFHGDTSLFDDGVRYLEERTGRTCAGVVPYFADAWKLPAEDAVALDEAVSTADGGTFKIAVPRLRRIANFDDIDPLKLEPGVTLNLIQPGEAIPGDTDLVILAGSKSTIDDLKDLRDQGWDIDLAAHLRRGGRVLGLCGGYQMLGCKIHDPEGIEGAPESIEGLGLLDVETTLSSRKQLKLSDAVHVASGAAIQGYEIHIGETNGPDTARPFAQISGRNEGAVSADGRVIGTYLHGVFSADGFRRAFLESLGAQTADASYDASVETALDELAAHLEMHLDISMLLDIAGK
ncbi:MAG: cobyric acid synthase [Hyphomicrobiales bacterium]